MEINFHTDKPVRIDFPIYRCPQCGWETKIPLTIFGRNGYSYRPCFACIIVVLKNCGVGEVREYFPSDGGKDADKS